MKKRRVLITGANGMLATDLIPLFSDCSIFAFGKDKLNIADRVQVEAAIFQTRPDIVLNCAAYTKVDSCEIDPTCYTINAIGTYHLAHACQKIKARLVHISTDYVFDGSKAKFYKEGDGRNPINHYGNSKFLGELAIEKELKNFLMLRVQWLFGHNGQNFVDTMHRIAKEKAVINVVDDQLGRPTNTFLLAQSIKQMIDDDVLGTFHLGAKNFCSWFDFAKEILKNNKNVVVLPCKSEDFPRPAIRPKHNVLDVSKALSLGVELKPWEEHLRYYSK